MLPVAPVAGLPTEILILIFSILSSIAPPRQRQHKSLEFKHELGWLEVTHVCRRWRNIAINEPILWASDVALPSRLGSHWADAFLSRAQDLPITMINRSESPSDIAFIGPNLARTRAILGLRIGANGLLSLCTPAPLLHTLNLTIYNNAPPLPFRPDSLFGGAAGLPELRHLSVVTWELQSWPPLLLEQLVSVDITIPLHDVPGDMFASMFAALGKMRGLERLAVQLDLEDADAVPVISLPALKSLTLQASIWDARLLLARLELPAGVRVRCDLYRSMDARAKISTLLPAMMACVDARHTPISIARVAVRRGVPDRRFPISGHFAEVRAWRSGDQDGAPAQVVRFSGWEDVPIVLGSIPSTHLEALAIGGCVRDAAWLDALKTAPRLRHVTVRSSAVPPFCAALGGAPGILPALATLVINIQAHLLAYTILTDALPRCLATRARAGNSLDELEVVGYDEDEACVHALREAVPGLVIRWSREAEPDELDDDNISDSEDAISDEEE